ncbi:alkanesulfonate monooxygenase SsuD/methylene tetrahydromethanopterin reductase-like flavin-dependent oxidoreductase (luciferase family) [Murinocardiopsis flavida]|uniref:Alkanesulfonate monooxygenase SsuD/methylene tetrahydromethanopterin reductase-like flavin-dependent oxidoreductase (Luciferase family) n=1 Tax=Murinocardiopsis flavida TaxID=645275 RepID=A0A2P8DST6_9ACTN|nr:LLM class flavin-dependent oxidoreductase [Murinocardiopsis flavida]PSL00274.1 alkanesulfonate monooxygenase SsuD/methylene tetrahydromethanopterin reductase-like flavin-dependent oxidoreductase (luciferase family) [Murinocardiopsis flavida]
MPHPEVAFQLPCRLPLSELVSLARQAEQAGFDEVWAVEDCFYAGGIATTASVLASTERVRVGIGILPAVARNPAFTAMELAAVAELHPGRLVAGIGHGVPGWMRQVGAAPDSFLTALGETLDAVRRLLHGETVTVEGAHVRLDGVRLEFPPPVVPQILAGVRRPKSLAVSGRHADGTLLAEPATPEYIAAARRSIDEGRGDVGRAGHRVTAYTWFHVAEDAAKARDALRPEIARIVAQPAWGVHLTPLDFAAELGALAELPVDERAAALRDEWIDALAVVGTPADCARRLGELHAAGADGIVLCPPVEIEDQLRLAAEHVLPLVRS